MDETNTLRVTFTCECGAQQEVVVARDHAQTDHGACIGCGAAVALDRDDIEHVFADYDRAVADALEHTRAALNESLAAATRGLKGVTYRPKR